MFKKINPKFFHVIHSYSVWHTYDGIYRDKYEDIQQHKLFTPTQVYIYGHAHTLSQKQKQTLHVVLSLHHAHCLLCSFG